MSTATTPRSPLAMLYQWEKTQADVINLTQPIGGGKVVEYTWAQSVGQARRMAAYLRSLNLPPRSNIALLAKNSAHWMICDWAIWMAGHVSVPLYPTLNAETVRYILEHSESKLLFIGRLEEWNDMKPGVPAGLPIVRLPLSPESPGALNWDDIVAKTTPIADNPDFPLDSLATIVYTSGSTGLPKGVMLSFNAFYVDGALMDGMFPTGPDDRMLSYLPLAHVAERMIVENNAVYHGFHVYFADTLKTFVDDLRRARPTLFFSVPRLWTKFQQGVCEKLPIEKQRLLFRIPFLGRRVKRKILEQLGLQDVRVAFTGAAPLPPESVAWYRSLGLELLEAYGMSENSAYSHMTRPGNARVGYVGPPNPGVECRIDPDSGEVLVKSPAQMTGYYKEPAKTAECYTADGFFKTGDMGEVDEQNRLRITGRVKDLFKISKGKYVAPVPIENKLGAHPKIEVVCVGGANQPATFALVILAEDLRRSLAKGGDPAPISAEMEALMNSVNATLDPHEQMQCVVVIREPWTIDNGMLTPTMKIRRNVIEKHYEPQVEGWFASRKTVIWEG